MSKRKFETISISDHSSYYDYTSDDYSAFLNKIMYVDKSKNKNEADEKLYNLMFPDLVKKSITFDKFVDEFGAIHVNFISRLLMENEISSKDDEYNFYMALFENKYTLECIIKKINNPCINSLNVLSFMEACLSNNLLLATVIQKKIKLSDDDILNIFAKCAINILPEMCKFLMSINMKACKQLNIENDDFLNLIYDTYNNIVKCSDEPKTVHIRFHKTIQILTSIDTKVIIYMNNSGLEAFQVEQFRYLYPHKINYEDFVKQLPSNVMMTDEIEKIDFIKNTPIIQQYCQACNLKPPTMLDYCYMKRNDPTFINQYCNTCVTQMLLKKVKCPLCSYQINMDELVCIVTDITDDDHFMAEFTRKITI